MSKSDAEFDSLKELQLHRDNKEREVFEVQQQTRMQKELADLETLTFETRIKEINDLENKQILRRQQEYFQLLKIQLTRDLAEQKDLEKVHLERRLRLKRAIEQKFFWKNRVGLDLLTQKQKVRNERENESIKLFPHLYESIDYLSVSDRVYANKDPDCDQPPRQPHTPNPFAKRLNNTK